MLSELQGHLQETCCVLLDIPVRDHVIIERSSDLSLAEAGLV
jgi:DNA repair protein RadC